MFAGGEKACWSGLFCFSDEFDRVALIRVCCLCASTLAVKVLYVGSIFLSML